MNRRAAIAVALAAGIGVLSLQASARVRRAGAELGKPFKAVALRDIGSGKMVDLGAFKGKKIVVGVFMAKNCGTTWRYYGKIGQLIQTYKKQGVEVVAIHSNTSETDELMKSDLDAKGLTIPLLDDKKGQVLKEYVGAVCTPTYFIVDKEGVMRYFGSFDKSPSETKASYVRDALDAILAGKNVPVNKTRPFG